MPPTRTLKAHIYKYSAPTKHGNKDYQPVTSACTLFPAEGAKVVDLSKCDIIYPVDDAGRQSFRTNQGKAPTRHQWAVYDFTRTIPVGKVTTYKDICVALGQGSPRSVGAALRNNPFAPFVPCHRVIASNRFVGGFLGEWGEHDKTGKQYTRKLEMLAEEGVAFTEKGFLLGGDALIWRG